MLWTHVCGKDNIFGTAKTDNVLCGRTIIVKCYRDENGATSTSIRFLISIDQGLM